jgi:hypothetical protein
LLTAPESFDVLIIKNIDVHWNINPCRTLINLCQSFE